MTSAAADQASERWTVYTAKSVRRAAKIAAAMDGKTLSEWVTEAINKALPAFELTASK